MGTLIAKNMMRYVLALAALAALASTTEAACASTAVCQKFYNGVLETTGGVKDLEKLENKISKWCAANKVRPYDKMCYYIEGVRRKISKDLMQGAPAELSCKRLATGDSAICTLKSLASWTLT